MDAISMARELGKQIQADERYKAYHTARELNDKDESLQKLIADFNEKRMELSGEMAKPDKDTEKLQKLDGEIKKHYEERKYDSIQQRKRSYGRTSLTDQLHHHSISKR